MRAFCLFLAPSNFKYKVGKIATVKYKFKFQYLDQLTFVTNSANAWRLLCCLCPCSFSVCWWDPEASWRGREVGCLGFLGRLEWRGEKDPPCVLSVGTVWKELFLREAMPTHVQKATVTAEVLLDQLWWGTNSSVHVAANMADPLKGMPAQFAVATLLMTFL